MRKSFWVFKLQQWTAFGNCPKQKMLPFFIFSFLNSHSFFKILILFAYFPLFINELIKNMHILLLQHKVKISFQTALLTTANMLPTYLRQWRTYALRRDVGVAGCVIDVRKASLRWRWYIGLLTYVCVVLGFTKTNLITIWHVILKTLAKII